MCDLTDTDRQILIGMSSVCIDHHMMRAVHRTKNERLSLHLHWWEHVFFVVIPVTGCLVQIYGTDTRSHNMQIAQLSFLVLDIILQLLPDHISLRKEHRKSTANQIINHKQVHVLSDFSVISFLCFL